MTAFTATELVDMTGRLANRRFDLVQELGNYSSIPRVDVQRESEKIIAILRDMLDLLHEEELRPHSVKASLGNSDFGF